jgi:hypothetical protein
MSRITGAAHATELTSANEFCRPQYYAVPYTVLCGLAMIRQQNWMHWQIFPSILRQNEIPASINRTYVRPSSAAGKTASDESVRIEAERSYSRGVMPSATEKLQQKCNETGASQTHRCF